MSMKSCNDTIENRTLDLPSCSAGPQPTSPPRAPCCFRSIRQVDVKLSVLLSLTADSLISISCSEHKNPSNSLMLSEWITCAFYLGVNRPGRNTGRVRSEPDGTRWRTGGEVKGKLANGVEYSHATTKHGVSSITKADVHTSAASSRLNWRPHRSKWTRPFRGRRNLVSARVPSRSARAIILLHRS